MGAQLPSIGRIVHFVQGGVHYAAIIVYIWSETCVNLYVFPNGVTLAPNGREHTAGLMTSVVYADVPSTENAPEYTWHWPEYVG